MPMHVSMEEEPQRVLCAVRSVCDLARAMSKVMPGHVSHYFSQEAHVWRPALSFLLL